MSSLNRSSLDGYSVPPPSLLDKIEAMHLPICKHCGEQFEDHRQDEDPPYQCRIEWLSVPQPTYGRCHSDDPRDFHPDHECCTKEEVANHKALCEIFDKAEADGKRRPTREELAPMQGKSIGVGITTYNPPVTCYEASETIIYDRRQRTLPQIQVTPKDISDE